MKNFAWIFGALAGLAICWLFGAAVAWDANPAHWSTFWRLWCIMWAIPWTIGASVSAHVAAN